MSTTIEAPADDVAAAPPRKRRRIWRWLTLVVVALIAAASAAFLVKVGTEQAVALGGFGGVHGPGAVNHADQFNGYEFRSWSEVDYQPGGTVRVDMGIMNVSHTQTITVRSITFDSIAVPNGEVYSPFSKATLAVDYGAHGGMSNPRPFHSFQLKPQDEVSFEWTLTMCPTGQVSPNGGNMGFTTFEVDYSYFGFHKHEKLNMAIPIQLDGVKTSCD